MAFAVALSDPRCHRARRHDLPLVCALYAKKSRREFACAFLPETRQLRFGPNGGLHEILYCGFGFVLTRRPLYETMQQQLHLPVCNQRFRAPLVPDFAPMIVGEGEEAWYLGEDYAFCERARQCGFRIMADTTIRLWHVGAYRFSWEEAGNDVQRFRDYTYSHLRLIVWLHEKTAGLQDGPSRKDPLCALAGAVFPLLIVRPSIILGEADLFLQSCPGRIRASA